MPTMRSAPNFLIKWCNAKSTWPLALAYINITFANLQIGSFAFLYPANEKCIIPACVCVSVYEMCLAKHLHLRCDRLTAVTHARTVRLTTFWLLHSRTLPIRLNETSFPTTLHVKFPRVYAVLAACSCRPKALQRLLEFQNKLYLAFCQSCQCDSVTTSVVKNYPSSKYEMNYTQNKHSEYSACNTRTYKRTRSCIYDVCTRCFRFHK